MASSSAKSKSPAFWFRSPKFRRAFALSAVVLATGGLVLYKAPTSGAFPNYTTTTTPLKADGKNSVAFRGPGVHGVVSLSHTKILSGTTTPVYAELKMVADAPTDRAPIRAPLSLAVVLDTSGSMSGEKIQDAKRSVLRLLADMRDEDEIAVIRYSDSSELVQHLARVGEVRSSLTKKIDALEAGGGTNIPGGLSHGLRALDEASKGRVRRIVLVSDGLDSTRTQSEQLARTSFASGITVSSLGIGLDFDESYMGSVSQNGHGNFAFIKDGGSLATFLKRELEQTATTTVEHAQVTFAVPPGMRFVSATGADATTSNGREVVVNLGALFTGDERRVIVELSADNVTSSIDLHAKASWSLVNRDSAPVTASIPTLSLVATSDASDVEKGRDPVVFASAISVMASKRQLEAQNAWQRGDVATATSLAAANEEQLRAAMEAAPAAAPTIAAQMNAYGEQKKSFKSVVPSSAAGRAASKAAAVKDLDNMNRKGF